MATIKKIEDLEVWENARIQAKNIWQIINDGPFVKDFELKNQINRSSGSVMDNIAEGFGRGGNKEFINFLSYARGSNEEVRSQLYRALDRNHIQIAQFDELCKHSNSIGMKINNLVEYLLKSSIKGQKFHQK